MHLLQTRKETGARAVLRARALRAEELGRLAGGLLLRVHGDQCDRDVRRAEGGRAQNAAVRGVDGATGGRSGRWGDGAMGKRYGWADIDMIEQKKRKPYEKNMKHVYLKNVAESESR